MSNRLYNILKWIAIIVMPALATLVSVVFPLWGLPHADEIAKTITAFATFLGAVLMVSSATYKDTDKEA